MSIFKVSHESNEKRESVLEVGKLPLLNYFASILFALKQATQRGEKKTKRLRKALCYRREMSLVYFLVAMVMSETVLAQILFHGR